MQESWIQSTPVWSPRQDRIAFLANDKETYGGASIRLVENGRSREVASQTYTEFERSWNFWSPSGRAAVRRRSRDSAWTLDLPSRLRPIQ
jgi:hypothetical protein